MQLLLDLGNTRLKWAWTRQTEWHTGSVPLQDDDLTAVLAAIGEPFGPPRSVALVSVARESITAALTASLTGKWGAPLLRIESEKEQLGVKNGYRAPRQLGADRWAALIAAHAQSSGALCVISCGTAVTVDALNRRGEFIGGAIFPGLDLMRASLKQGTAAIGDADGSDRCCQATATADAVASGTRFGLAGAIHRLVVEHRAILGDDTICILHGGGADAVLPLLEFPVRHVPDLVLLGVKRILEARL